MRSSFPSLIIGLCISLLFLPFLSLAQVCTPTIVISSSPNGVPCPNTPVLFSAITTNTGSSPAFQWFKNGAPVGLNLPTYVDFQLALNDQIYCRLISNASCWNGSSINSNTIIVNNTGVLSTVAGSGNPVFAGDGGPGMASSLNFPIDITFDKSGHLYIADASNHRIRKVDAVTGIITTVAGNGNSGFSGDGGLAINAMLNHPTSVSFDATGNMYIADRLNHRIRKVMAGTDIITTIAGTGGPGFSGDGGPATNANLRSPLHVVLDAADNIYFTDRENNRVRKIAAGTGAITTVAGTGAMTFTGDNGPATSAALWWPTKICFDPAGNLIIADWGNHRIRKVSAVGIITTLIGQAASGSSGDGGPAANASLNYPTGLCYDASGNLYIGDVNHVIRKVDAATGIIDRIVGTATMPGFSPDGVEALNARINGPSGMAFNAAGILYFSDYLNHRIRKLQLAKMPASRPVLTASVNSICSGGSTTLSISSGNLNNAQVWKWYANACGGTPVGTGTSITVSPAASTTYYVRGEGDCVPPGTCGEQIITVSNTTAPTINIAASSTLYCYNQPPMLSASVNNAGPNPAYQWKVNGSNAGTNAAAFTGTVRPNDRISCELTATNNCGFSGTISSNTITIQSNPGFDLPPDVAITASQQSSCAGTPITFTATNVSASASPVYQWLVDGVASGTNSPSFTTSTLRNGAVVECIMTAPHCGSGGSTKDVSNAIPITISSQLIPSITIMPSATTTCKGQPVTFTAKAEQAGANPTFRWLVNGVAATINSTSFTSTTLKDGDVVQCEVVLDPNTPCANQLAVLSNTIAMNVREATAPSIQIAASQSIICAGTPVTFTAITTDAGASPTYQWQVNGVAVGSNAPRFSSATLQDGSKVTCVLTSNVSCVGVVSSNIIPLVVHPKPVVRFDPASVVISTGQQAQLTALVDIPVSSHQWTPANLLTDPSTFTPVTAPLNSSTKYQLIVTTDKGCSDSNAIEVMVYNQLFMPNSFTPNGDGKNDVFRIPPATFLKLREFAVFDRWGNKIFTTSNIEEGWNGKFRNNALPTNTFTYSINGWNDKGEVRMKGTVQLIR